MTRPKLLWTYADIYEDLPNLRQILCSFADVDVVSVDLNQLTHVAGAYDIIVPRIEHEIDVQFMNAAGRLRMIGTPTTGTDHINLAEAERRGIAVVSIKDDRALLDEIQSTAELAWLLILACSRKLPAAMQQVQQGGWDRAAVRGHELIGRTLGIIGYGRLGAMVGRFAQAFRMRVLATDPHPMAVEGVEQVSLEALLAQSDIITLHVHLNESTREMIGPAQFAQMKNGAVLVNTSRGGLIDEAAMLDALQSGRLSAAGLDVVQQERSPSLHDRPLLRYAREHDNVIITPHVGGCTFEAQAKSNTYFAQKLRDAWEAMA